MHRRCALPKDQRSWPSDRALWRFLCSSPRRGRPLAFPFPWPNTDRSDRFGACSMYLQIKDKKKSRTHCHVIVFKVGIFSTSYCAKPGVVVRSACMGENILYLVKLSPSPASRRRWRRRLYSEGEAAPWIELSCQHQCRLPEYMVSTLLWEDECKMESRCFLCKSKEDVDVGIWRSTLKNMHVGSEAGCPIANIIDISTNLYVSQNRVRRR